jgi:hypothetical protein
LKRREIIETADVLINVAGTLERPWDYRAAKKLVYIDTDPVFCQIGAEIGADSKIMRQRLDAHDVFFTLGECLSSNDAIPRLDRPWNETKYPIVLDQWRAGSAGGNRFTTIMNWSSYGSLNYRDQCYGQKGAEFMKYIELPQRVLPISLEVALYKPGLKSSRDFAVPVPLDRLAESGWKIVDAAEVCPDFQSYRRYIHRSKAEWSVAKGGYVLGRSGWFSCRSACYLAAGRPVVVQDTGFSKVLPTGEGVIGFNTLAEAQAGIREVEANYRRHAKAAQDIAEAYFDSDKVLRRLLDIAMNA